MTPVTTSAFDLPDHLAAKADPALIAGDEQHFAAIAESLEQSIADLSDRLDAARKAPGGTGQEAMDRDQEIHRLTARLRTLRRFGLDLCLGRMVARGRRRARVRRAARPHRQRRSPAAASTGAPPRPSRSSARPTPTRWAWRAAAGTAGPAAGSATTGTRCSPPDGLEGHAALDDQSAFIASLGSSRSPRMRDVLGTIQADQDAIIRAGSRGALVVDGGPGTGKTVVALHRTAYLLYSDPRLGHRRGGVLFVGPHQPYLAYVADVLPSLGEEGVQTCTLRDLVPEGAAAAAEADPEVARLKSSADMVRAIEPAVRLYEEPPTEGMEVETPWADIWLSADDWAEAFDAPEPGTPHNEARDQVWEELLDDPGRQARRRGGRRPTCVRRSLRAERGAARTPSTGRGRCSSRPTSSATCGRCRPTCALCAPWLEPDEVRTLQRDGRPGLDRVRPAAPRRRPAAARRPGGVPAQAPARGGRRRRARADGPGRRRPPRGRRRRERLMAMLRERGHPRRPRRRGRAARAPTRTCSPARSRTSSSTRPRS